MRRALGYGVCILAAANALWLLALQAQRFSMPLAWLLGLSPLIAGFVTACVAPARKVEAGASMALPAAALAALGTWVMQQSGPVDFPGLEGGLILFGVTLAWSAVLSSVGGLGGAWLTETKRGDPPEGCP